MLQPERTLEASVAEQPVIAEVNSQSAEDENSNPGERETRPTEEPGKERQ
jgi:hypothetical protein